jgi:hypothetical protein
MDFLNLLNDCKRENELLEKKLSDLEKNHHHLLKINEKLQEPLNNPSQQPGTTTPKTNPKPEQIPQQQHSSFQPITMTQKSVQTAPSAQLVLPKTPVKQSNSLLISASPISSASSPNNSSLQNISFESHLPTSAQKSSVIKNNTINNTSINNNINLISQADSCFYNLNSFGKMDGLKNVSLNYSNMNRNGIETNNMAADLMVNSMAMASDLASQYQMSGHNLNQSQHLAAALSELTKAQVNNFTFFLERGGAEAEANREIEKRYKFRKMYHIWKNFKCYKPDCRGN